jgi:transcriptional regulator with XRE-family HTH domain
MQYGALPKTLGERVAVALKRRLFPNTNMTRKQLQDALKCSVGTMDNLLSGNHDPSGRILDRLVSLFRESFVNEVWGAHNIHCISTLQEKRVAALRKIEEAQQELRALG